MRPSGIVARNFARFSGVSGMPMNCSSRPVSPITGQMALTRMRSGPNSTASDFDNRFTAPLLALYQVRPGRGRMPAVDPMFRITPPFLLAHQRHHREHHVIDRLDVHREHLVERGFVDIEQRHVGMCRARVVDDDIGRAELFDARTNQRIDIALHRDIAACKQSRGTELARQRFTFAAVRDLQSRRAHLRPRRRARCLHRNPPRRR